MVGKVRTKGTQQGSGGQVRRSEIANVRNRGPRGGKGGKSSQRTEKEGKEKRERENRTKRDQLLKRMLRKPGGEVVQREGAELLSSTGKTKKGKGAYIFLPEV